MSAMDALARIRSLGGAARFSEIGTSRYRLSIHVARGELRRLARGAYALPNAHPAMCSAVAHNAVVTCCSALSVYGVETVGDGSITHLALPPGRGNARGLEPRTRRHRERPDLHHGTRLATLVDATARAAVCLPYDDAVAQVERAAFERDSQFISQVLAKVQRTKPSRARALAIDVQSGSRSTMETQVRLGLRRAGLSVLSNVHIPGVGEVDFVVDGVLIVELDGFAYHSERKPYRTDRRRDRAALRLGLPTMRFAFEDSAPERVVREVASYCRALRRDTPPAVGSPEVLARVAKVIAPANRPEARATGWTHLTGKDRIEVEAKVADLIRAAQG